MLFNQKVLQHLKSIEMPEIFRSPFGTKLDPRLVRNFQIQMDERGNVTVDDRNVVIDFPCPPSSLGRGDFSPFASQTIVRAFEKDGVIHFFDNEDTKEESKLVLTVNTQNPDSSGAFLLRLGRLDDQLKNLFRETLQGIDP